jgi:DNA sulfur modification protein DndE
LKTDSVISTISDLTERTIFRPEMPPARFFEQSWIITFAGAHDTQKNLAAYMLLDALNTFLKRTAEAPQDAEGHRAIRAVLAVDEARHLLASRHKALSDNIRLHRSKGLMVALASQSPDDYDGAGTIILKTLAFRSVSRRTRRATRCCRTCFGAK